MYYYTLSLICLFISSTVLWDPCLTNISSLTVVDGRHLSNLVLIHNPKVINTIKLLFNMESFNKNIKYQFYYLDLT